MEHFEQGYQQKTKQQPKTECFIQQGETIRDQRKIAVEFNKYFTNIGKNLAKQIKNRGGDVTKTIEVNQKNTIYLNPTDENEIQEIISKSENKTSEDIDGLTMEVLKKISSAIIQPITTICNRSLEEGHFPQRMKEAKVIPRYKKDDP